MDRSCRWDEHEEVGFCSERVEILFSAIYDTSKELAAKAMAVQNRSVINHVAELVSLSSSTDNDDDDRLIYISSPFVFRRC